MSSPRPNLDLIKHICPFNSILPKISIPNLCPIRWLKNDEIEILPMLYPGVGVSYPIFLICRKFFNTARYLKKREFDLSIELNFANRSIKYSLLDFSVLKTFLVSSSTKIYRRTVFVSKNWSSIPEFHRVSMLMLAHFSVFTFVLVTFLIKFMQNLSCMFKITQQLKKFQKVG